MVCVASRFGLQRRARDVPHGNQAVAAYVLDGRTSAAKAFDRLGFRVGNPLGNWFSSIPVTRRRYPNNEHRIATRSLRRKWPEAQAPRSLHRLNSLTPNSVQSQLKS